LLAGRNRRNTGDIQGWPSVRELLGMAWTFAAVTVAWVFFRAESVGVAWEYLCRLSNADGHLELPPMRYSAHIALLLVAEWFGKNRLLQRKRFFEWGRYAVLIMATLLILRWFGSEHANFIYFQF